MNMTAGFIPGAECPAGHICSHVFLRASLEGVFPVVDRSGAIGGQMGDPAGFCKLANQGAQAVFYKMCSIG